MVDYDMVQQMKKKTLFIIGVMITTFIGATNNYVRTQYSKVGSLILDSAATTAYADNPITGSPGGWGSDGGCSGGDSA